MRREEFFDILGQIDDRFIIPARRERRVIPWQNYVGVAAALCVMVTGLWLLIHMGSTGIGLLPGKPTDPTHITIAPSDPTEESTEPTNPTETIFPEPELAPDAYASFRRQCYPFRFDGDRPTALYDIDTSQCKVGLLYVYDTVQKQVHQITDQELVEGDCFFSTLDHLYYRLQADPSAIIRSDYSGENQTVIYRSNYGRIDGADYYGTNPEGKIITRENNNRVCMYDIATETATVLMERYHIASALYSEDSVYFIGEKRYEGPMIFWSGQIDANSAVDEYLYCIGEDMDRPLRTEESQPPFSEIYVFTYQEKQPLDSVRLDLSQCQRDHLYYCHEESKKVVPICDEPVVCFGYNKSGLYFVKKAEPNKLYRAQNNNLTDQHVAYTSDFGPITNIFTDNNGHPANPVMLTEGNKRGVLFDPNTGGTEVFIQQYYIEDAIIADLARTDWKWTYNKIWFRGKLNEEDTLKDYFYWIDSDSITEDLG